jgi:hypothetical protein
MRTLTHPRTRHGRYAARRPPRPGPRRPRPLARLYLGARPRRPLLARRPYPAAPVSGVREWLGGAAMVLGVVSWGMVLTLLAG